MSEPAFEIGLRFVPGGWRRHGTGKDGVWLACGTLLASPVRAGEGCGIPVTLQAWPKTVEALLVGAEGRERGVELLVSPVQPGAGQDARPAPLRPAHSVTAQRAYAFPAGDSSATRRRAQQAKALQTRWEKLLTPNPAGWSALAQALAPDGGSATVDKLDRAGTPDVVSSGRADLGVLLALDRAGSLVKRMRGGDDTRTGEALQTRPKRPDDRLPAWLAHAEKDPDEREKARQSDADNGLRSSREAAYRKADARKGYRSASGPKDLDAALRALGASKRGELTPGAGAEMAAGDDSRPLQTQIDQSRTLHYAAGVHEPVPEQPDLAAQEIDNARARFIAIQSDPALARLFNLAIDVVVLEHDLLGSLGGAPFAFVAARFVGSDGQSRLVWTTTKIGRPEEDAAHPDPFWPCTREELDARALGWDAQTVLDVAVPTQMDGLIYLGARQNVGGEVDPRYDLVTFDVPRGAETDIDADCRAYWSDPEQKQTKAFTVASGGLLVVDRWRHYHVIAQAADGLARRKDGLGSDPVIDADDLTVGVRMDVALATGGKNQWRSLMERSVAFDKGLLRDAFETLVPEAGERDRLQAGMLSVPARMRTNAGSDAPSKQTAFVEEVMAQWRGAPLGVDLHAATVTLREDALQVGRVYGLPTKGDRPPRQCFGWANHVGLRAQYGGGVCRPVESAARAYEQAGQVFALPPTGSPGRRVLRHERVEAPAVATPLQILHRIVSGAQETAGNLVVRTTTNGDGQPALTPATTFRVLVPPPVTLDFADRHDVFDPARAGAHPRGGLRDLDYDRVHGGTFPVWSTQVLTQGAVYPDKAEQPGPTGDAIFRPLQLGDDPDKRPHPFYPDPAAELMVFMLRQPGGAPLPGEPLVIRVRQDGVHYPDVTPVALELVSDKKTTPGEARQEGRLAIELAGGGAATGAQAWTKTAAAVWLDETCGIYRSGGWRRVRAVRVQVALQPGESYDLDVWCVPKAETLADWFDLVETSALVVQAHAGSANGCLRGAAFCEALASACGVAVPLVAPASAVPGGCGVGQLAIPGAPELRCMADAIYAKAIGRVTPEIAARTTFTLVHAIDRPERQPSAGRVDQTGQALGLARLTAEARTALLTGPVNGGVVCSEPGGKDVVLFGSVGVDYGTAGFVEVRASGPELVSGAFDDRTRGRTADDQARGIWPEQVDRSGRSLPYRPHDVLGFDVRADDTVTLYQQQAVLLRIDRLEYRPTRMGRLEALDLLARQRYTPDAGGLAVAENVSYPFSIGDTKARVLELRVVTGSRTASAIRLPGQKPLAQCQQIRQSEPVRLALPATTAPARVEPLTVMPAFNLESYQQRSYGQVVTFGVRRKVRLRVRARRPWFSSGAGERLGVVLWPPEIFDGVVQPGANAVLPGYSTVGGEDPTIDMTGFADRDLGPGGAFVSRWGADPTTTGRRFTGWLMPPTAFSDVPAEAMGAKGAAHRRPWDLTAPDADEQDVVYVPRARMPIPLAPGQSVPAGERGALDVALLTVRPRFDIDREFWYFDLALNTEDVPEPFVRLGLVRYQANALPEMRVSEPVVEWVQVPPERDFTIQVRKASDGGHRIAAQVTGPGWASAASSEQVAVRAKPGLGDLNDGPLMDFTLYRRDADGIETAAGAAPGQSVRPFRSTGGVTWQAELSVSEDPLSPAAGASYSVVASERRVMRPASYALEPFDPARAETDEETAITGPRYAARVTLPSLPLPALPKPSVPQAPALWVFADAP